MKTKSLVVAILAIMLFAVQGYAQGARGHGHHHGGRGNDGRSRTEHYQSGHGTRSGQHGYRGDNRATRQGGNHKGRDNHSYGAPPKHGNHHMTPPSHGSHYHGGHSGSWYSSYNHHHSYRHHHHNCVFDSWSWYSWRGYTNRFIRHNYYHNRYFDSMLGYYLWDSFDAPTRIDIGTMSFTRYQGRLKIVIGSNVSYLDLHQYHTVTYQVGNTFVKVTTDSGYATLYLYDEYGNTATYRL